MRSTKLRLALSACSVLALAGAATLVPDRARAQTAGRTAGESPPPAWPAIVRPAADAPTVLLILTDDVGFGASSTFGGPIPTPTFDALARRGARFNEMHTTGICSPTRAALLTGRNHNAVNVGNVLDASTGYEGYTGIIPKSTATVAELLRGSGYATAMFGKAHLTPQWETSAAGPFDHWPTGLGFDYFYGFLSGDTNQYAPALYENTRPVEPPTSQPGYILDRDLADRAVQWMRQTASVAPGRPQFIYFAPGTAHAPHHAPRDWIDRFKGRFDQGWDAVRAETLARQKALGVVPADTKLSERSPGIPAWDTLSAEQRRIYAREMEVYAGAVAYADDQIGRVIGEARRQFGDKLMVIYIQGDNGSSAEGGLNGTFNENMVLNGVSDDLPNLSARLDTLGGPESSPHFSYGWAHAMNTPFPWVKQIASHLGATRNGMVIDWPGHVPHPEIVRPQFQHVIDIAPTILDVAHVPQPASWNGVAQKPFDGISLRYALEDPAAAPQRHTQYFTIWDNLAIYHDGWLASTYPESMPWNVVGAAPPKVNGRTWELYDLTHDFSQSTNLAAANPARLAEMRELYWATAARSNALPIHRYEGRQGVPSYLGGRSVFIYDAPLARTPAEAAPSLLNRSWVLTADVDLSGDGVLLAQGGKFGGLSWYVTGGRPAFAYNWLGRTTTRVIAPAALAAGPHRIEAHFQADSSAMAAGGTVRLLADGKELASGRIERTIPFRLSLDETFDVGSDTGTPVSTDYASPSPMAGLKRLEVDLISPAQSRK